jgi:hypothetical protein
MSKANGEAKIGAGRKAIKVADTGSMEEEKDTDAKPNGRPGLRSSR